jgi:hypothetical protein
MFKENEEVKEEVQKNEQAPNIEVEKLKNEYFEDEALPPEVKRTTWERIYNY